MRDSYEDSPAQTREAGLRRLGRLTWRTTQLGALATVGFAIVFARDGPAETASNNTPPHHPHATPPPPPPAWGAPSGAASAPAHSSAPAAHRLTPKRAGSTKPGAT